MPIAVLVVKIALAGLCGAGAWLLPAPMLAGARGWLLIAIVFLAAAVMAASRNWIGGRRQNMAERFDVVPFGIAATALTTAIVAFALLQTTRDALRDVEPARLQRLGRHIMVGYSDIAWVRDLVERRAIGGIFITRRNVGDRKVQAIAAEIAGLQAIRSRQGLPPLWVATDQEGGKVSRMSPPLTALPALSSVVAAATGSAAHGTGAQASLDNAVAHYAGTHGRELAAAGINLNFAPVVDLDRGVLNAADAFTQISQRAISSQPALVASVAGRYCDGLARHGVACTLKHFPGLGRVFEDTHISEGTLPATAADLEASDWIPFRSLMASSANGTSMAGAAARFTMMAHVRLPTIDAERPASTSKPVIEGLIRQTWRHDGPIITDDFCMGAIYFSKRGIGGASVDALNAGVDLILVSWDGRQIYPVLAALIAAERNGTLDGTMLARSAHRLNAARQALAMAKVAS